MDKKDDKKTGFEGPEHIKRLKFEPDKVKAFEEAWKKRMGKPTKPEKKK